ncbi:MAG TPA: PspC family transcriptional regulator [Bacteroidetes bacterium]|nr:PspC family transcriptional regulator [Bacteroidota bacterium]
MNRIKLLIEKNIFGVCSSIGERLGIAPSTVRLYFIYTSFINLTSPLIIYLVFAFWINMKKYLTSKRNPVWE